MCPAVSVAIEASTSEYSTCCCRVPYNPFSGAYARLDVFYVDEGDSKNEALEFGTNVIVDSLNAFTASARLPCDTTIAAYEDDGETVVWRYAASKTSCVSEVDSPPSPPIPPLSPTRPVCGNGVCEARIEGGGAGGENCISCPADCRSSAEKGLCCGLTSLPTWPSPCPSPECFKQDLTCAIVG